MDNYFKNQFIRWYFNKFSRSTLFVDMQNICEDSPWHREANVGVHTNMVVAEYIGFDDHGSQWDREDLIGALVCAFHDVGKPAARKEAFKPERGTYFRYGGHEQISARLWEDYAARNWIHLVDIFKLCPHDVFVVSWLIEYHLPWGIKKTDKLNNIAATVDWIIDPTVYTDILRADTLGRISDDYVEKRKKVSDWVDNFHNNLMHNYLSADDEPMGNQPTLIMPIAVSGSGKTTYRNTLDGFDNYSWDDLRMEFYDPDYNIAYKMACDDKAFGRRVNERFMEMVKTGNNLFIDNVNVSKKRRAFFLTEAKRRGYFVKAVLFPITKDELKARQRERKDKTVPDFVIDSQYGAMQMPSIGEFHKIEVIGSNLPDIV